MGIDLIDLPMSLYLREKVAVVGRNGAGKSTLLKVIAGIAHADSGDVDVPKGTKIAYLRQEIDFWYADFGHSRSDESIWRTQWDRD